MSERPVRPATIDRDQAQDRLWAIFNDEDVWDQGYGLVIERILDALAAAVRPVAIDRDALVDKVAEIVGQAQRPEVLSGQAVVVPDWVADEIVALVRPVAGVVLSPEEAALLGRAATKWANAIETASAMNELTEPQIEQVFSDDAPQLRALAARLEATDDAP